MKRIQIQWLAPLLVIVALTFGYPSTARTAQGSGPSTVFLPLVQSGAPAIPPVVYAKGTVGYDISFPECGIGIPAISTTGAPYRFAIVGINDGRAFTPNPCLGAEYQLATSQGLQISFYQNLNAPIGSTAYKGQNGPKGFCAPGDGACLSYNYGYNAAMDAFGYATTTTGRAGMVWWLDIETANSWEPNPAWNAQTIQGAIDFYQQANQLVGIYSIPSMWDQSTPLAERGTMLAGNAPLLLPQIAGSGFRPGVPEWTTGARSLSSAPQLCPTSPFTSEPIWLAQEPRASYDEDYAC